MKVKDYIIIKTDKGDIPAIVESIMSNEIKVIHEDTSLPKGLSRYKKSSAFYQGSNTWVISKRNSSFANRTTKKEFIDLLKIFINQSL